MLQSGLDLYDLPGSEKRFPDGGQYRIEIAGVEHASSMEALADEADKRGVSVHRVIATVGGATYCDFQELRAMARIAQENRIEVIMTIGPRKGWDPGAKESMTSEGQMQGFRLRGSDNLCYWIADMFRCTEAGFRGFLVFDEGLLSILNQMRLDGRIPKNVIFKYSVFGGCCNAAGAKLIEQLGADSLNPISDVSLPILSKIRGCIDIPLDVYFLVVDSFGGHFRIYETPEIARIASPCYFKFEPGTSEADIYKPWVDEQFHAEFVRKKVKIAAIVLEILERHAPEIRISKKGAADLVVPESIAT